MILARVFIAKTKNLDPTYAIGFCSSAVEVNVAVVTACAPSMKAIGTRYLPKILGSSHNEKSDYGTGTGSGSREGHKFGVSHLFNKPMSHSISLSRPTKDGGYEMADPMGGPQIHVEAGDDVFDVRKYKRGTDSPSLMTSDDDDISGIVRTTDITIGFVVESAHGGIDRLYGTRPSVDSMV